MHHTRTHMHAHARTCTRVHVHTHTHTLTRKDDLEGETGRLLVVAASEDKGERNRRLAFRLMLFVVFDFMYFIYSLSSAGTALHASNPRRGQLAPLSEASSTEPLARPPSLGRTANARP